MKNNRWSVYKTKSRAKDTPEPAAKPSTAGKAAMEGARVGQGRGKQNNVSIIRGKVKIKSYPHAKMPLSLATKPKKAELVSFLPVNFTVEGDVVPQGRPRFFRRGNMVGVYDPPKSKAWKKLVADTAIAHGCKPLDGPLEVTLMFYLKQPKTMKDDQPHIKRPDVDNCAKGVLDALNGICWHDDAQICMLVVEKDYGVWPEVNIEIGPYWKYVDE